MDLRQSPRCRFHANPFAGLHSGLRLYQIFDHGHNPIDSAMHMPCRQSFAPGERLNRQNEVEMSSLQFGLFLLASRLHSSAESHARSTQETTINFCLALGFVFYFSLSTVQKSTSTPMSTEVTPVEQEHISTAVAVEQIEANRFRSIPVFWAPVGSRGAFGGCVIYDAHYHLGFC